MHRGDGFGIEEYSDTCCSGRFTNSIRIIPSWDGSGINLFAEDFGEYFDAPGPFVSQFLLAAV